MKPLDHARVLIYRINKKGLEIFLINPDEGQGDNWQIPKGVQAQHLNKNQVKTIDLEPVEQVGGQMETAWAIECDSHEIPSIRAIIKEDVRIVKNQIKQQIPDLERGTYYTVKEAIKKVMPGQYAYLKELKDIVNERNQTMYI